MKCPFCKNEHPEDSHFCPVTGKAIAQLDNPQIADTTLICKNCKTKIPTEARFCPVCGAAFTASILLNRGIPVITVSRRLGHARASINLDIYAHLIPTL
jgi:RNA polymerase subunit RPABC4/transcription elongation factor Spt4